MTCVMRMIEAKDIVVEVVAVDHALRSACSYPAGCVLAFFVLCACMSDCEQFSVMVNTFCPINKVHRHRA